VHSCHLPPWTRPSVTCGCHVVSGRQSTARTLAMHPTGNQGPPGIPHPADSSVLAAFSLATRLPASLLLLRKKTTAHPPLPVPVLPLTPLLDRAPPPWPLLSSRSTPRTIPPSTALLPLAHLTQSNSLRNLPSPPHSIHKRNKSPLHPPRKTIPPRPRSQRPRRPLPQSRRSLQGSLAPTQPHRLRPSTPSIPWRISGLFRVPSALVRLPLLKTQDRTPLAQESAQPRSLELLPCSCRSGLHGGIWSSGLQQVDGGHGECG
jgi:hypothetical protein